MKKGMCEEWSRSAPCDCSPGEVGYDEGRLEALNVYLRRLIGEGVILSGSYCLWRRGRVFADTALGGLACAWQGREQFFPDTFFEVQSVTKVFVALAVLKLAEDGVLFLGQPVCHWIPEFLREGFRDITILHLLTHTSGLCALPGALPEDERPWWRYMEERKPGESWIMAVIRAGLHAEPGSAWIYSAAGFPLLGEIIERATGMKAESFIRENIFLPCGMAETHWRQQTREEWVKRYNIAKPLDVELARRYGREGYRCFSEPTYVWWDEVPDMSGGVMSTGREMVRLGEMLLRDGYYRGTRVIGRKALDLLWTNMIPEGMRDYCFGHPGLPIEYGAGMAIVRKGKDLSVAVSDSVICHEGSGVCMFLVDREEDFAAVFQTSFPREGEWRWDAVKGTVSVLWSGL